MYLKKFEYDIQCIYNIYYTYICTPLIVNVKYYVCYVPIYYVLFIARLTPIDFNFHILYNGQWGGLHFKLSIYKSLNVSI